jgi:hypothetical protein
MGPLSWNIVRQCIPVYAIGKASPDGWGASWQKLVARLCETELFYNKMFVLVLILKAENCIAYKRVKLNEI